MKSFFICMLLALSTSLIACGPSSAHYFDGNRLKSLVDSDDSLEAKNANNDDIFQSGMLFGYVVGVYESVEDNLVCSPENVKPGQLIGIVKKFVRDSPEVWDMPANKIVIMALSRIFPCQKGRKSK